MIWTKPQIQSLPIKFYVASSIENKVRVQDVFSDLARHGHEVVTDWTLADSIHEEERDQRADEIGAVAKRDLEGIQECDVFIILGEPPEGRSMYVELGAALALNSMTDRPALFVVGERRNQSIFHYHPAVQHVRNMAELLERTDEAK